MIPELESAKCILHDEGFIVDSLNEYQVRAINKDYEYVFDLWASFTKRGRNFKGYTILKWKDKTYHRDIFDLDIFILENK